MTEPGSPEARAEALALLRKAKTDKARSDRMAASRDKALGLSVVRALSAGVPAAEIAEVLDVSRQRVYQIRDETLAPKPAGQ